MSAYDILTARGVTRLCHFTLFKSLTHIITADDGILSSSFIRQDTKNVTDKGRFDNELDYVCCSVQYPNSWFLKKAMQNNTDNIFIDWVVMYIGLSILNEKRAKYCPCNASKENGKYINGNMDEVGSIFDTVVPSFSYRRSPRMLASCPTDGQAEILIKDSIPRDHIIGIATGNEDVAKRVYSMLKTYSVERIPIYIAPDVITPSWSNMVREGRLPDETPYDGSKED